MVHLIMKSGHYKRKRKVVGKLGIRHDRLICNKNLGSQNDGGSSIKRRKKRRADRQKTRWTKIYITSTITAGEILGLIQ